MERGRRYWNNLPSAWLDQWNEALARNLYEVPLKANDQGPRVKLNVGNRLISRNEGCDWLFLKIATKKVTKRMVNGHMFLGYLIVG